MNLEFSRKIHLWLFRSLIFLIGFTLCLYLLKEPSILGPILIASMIKIMIEPIQKFLKQLGFFHISALVLSVLIFLGFSFLGIYYLGPLIKNEFGDFFKIENIKAIHSNFKNFVNLYLIKFNIKFDLNFIDQNIIPKLQDPSLLEWASKIVLWAAISPIFLFFFIFQGNQIRNYAFQLIPNQYFELFSQIIFKIWFQTSNYVRARIVEALVMFVLSLCTLWLCHFPFVFLLSFFAALNCNLVIPRKRLSFISSSGIFTFFLILYTKSCCHSGVIATMAECVLPSVEFHVAALKPCLTIRPWQPRTQAPSGRIRARFS